MFMRFSTLVFALVLMLGLAPAALAADDCDSRESNYARAVQLHEMGDYARALRQYECALREDPEDAIIPILIENVYDDMARSATAWSGGNEAAPDRVCDPARDHAQIGADAYDNGDHVLADIYLQCVLAQDPEHLQALTLLGHIYMNRGETRSAKYYFDRAYDLRASHIVISTSKPSDTLAATDAPAGFVMPDWLGPYETVPRERSPGGAIDIATALGAFPDRHAQSRVAARDQTGARAHLRRGRTILVRVRITFEPREAAPAPDVEAGHPHARCALGRLYMAQGNYAAAFGQFYPLLANGLYDQCPD